LSSVGADLADRGQQHVVLDVEDAGGVVRAFEEGAEAGEIEDVVAQHRAVQRAAHQGRLLADGGEDLGQVALAHRAGEQAPRLHPAFIGGLPDLAREGGAHEAGVVARRSMHASTLEGLAGSRSMKSMAAAWSSRSWRASYCGAHPGGIEDAGPFVVGIGGAGEGDAEPRLDQASGVFAALQVAKHPHQPAGRLAQHHRLDRGNARGREDASKKLGRVWARGRPRARAYFHKPAKKTGAGASGPLMESGGGGSFLEHPCILGAAALGRIHHERALLQRDAGQAARGDFDPFGATRTKGRRSTWRGARPALVRIGTVESASVGWAM
jgi:hypothetical protein